MLCLRSLRREEHPSPWPARSTCVSIRQRWSTSVSGAVHSYFWQLLTVLLYGHKKNESCLFRHTLVWGGHMSTYIRKNIAWICVVKNKCEESTHKKSHFRTERDQSSRKKRGGWAAAVGDLGAGAKVCIKYFSTSKAIKHTCFSSVSSSSCSL